MYLLFIAAAAAAAAADVICKFFRSLQKLNLKEVEIFGKNLSSRYFTKSLDLAMNEKLEVMLERLSLLRTFEKSTNCLKNLV